MPKRFFQTEKFNDEFYFNLSDKNKVVWEYMLCSCDSIGQFVFNSKAIDCFANVKISIEEFERVFMPKLIKLEVKTYLIKKFMINQYGPILKNASPPHRGIIKKLQEKNFVLVDVSAGVSVNETMLATFDADGKRKEHLPF